MFEDIDADVYVMADGDDTYPADAAPAMVAKVLEGYDMVIGDRLSSTYFQENKRPFHNFGNRLVRGSINHLFRAHVTDIMTGYRAFSFTFVKNLSRAVTRLRGRDRDDDPLAEQRPASVRNAHPVPRQARRLRLQAGHRGRRHQGNEHHLPHDP